MAELGKCGDCGRAGAERDGCSCITDAFRELLDGVADAGPPCECLCTSPSAPHSDRPCGRAATTMVAIHAWGCCNEPDPVTPDAMDVYGNLCVLMCGPCARHAEQRAAANIRKLRANTPSGVVVECPTCGRPTERTSDLIELRPM